MRFPALHVYEDEYFTTRVLLKAEKIVTVASPLYRYCFNPGSLTNERGRSLLKKKNRLQSAILKQELSAEARAHGVLWKQALDISCLKAACEAFSSLSRDPQTKRELLEMAHALAATVEPLPSGYFPRLTAYSLLTMAFRHKSPDPAGCRSPVEEAVPAFLKALFWGCWMSAMSCPCTRLACLIGTCLPMRPTGWYSGDFRCCSRH